MTQIERIIWAEMGFGLEPEIAGNGRMRIVGVEKTVKSLAAVTKDIADQYNLWRSNLQPDDYKQITGDIYDHFIENIAKLEQS